MSEVEKGIIGWIVEDRCEVCGEIKEVLKVNLEDEEGICRDCWNKMMDEGRRREM